MQLFKAKCYELEKKSECEIRRKLRITRIFSILVEFSGGIEKRKSSQKQYKKIF